MRTVLFAAAFLASVVYGLVDARSQADEKASHAEPTIRQACMQVVNDAPPFCVRYATNGE